MEMLDLLRFSLGSAMLCYGSWTDLKTRRVPNEVWLISGSIASVLLIYDLSTQDWGYHVWALLFATFVLFYNAFVDEYVLEDNQAMLWRVFQVLAILSALYFLLTVDSEEISSENYKLIDILSISVLMILMYVWYYLGPTIGGADVKAIMTIGLVAPFTFSINEDHMFVYFPSIFTYFPSIFPYPFVIFMNSLLLYLLIPIGLALYNIVRGNIEKPYFQIFFGTKMPLKAARESFVWPMQQVVGEKVVMVAFVKHKSDSESEWDKLEKKGITNPWITFKIPYIIPLTLAFFVSALFGDLFSVILVERINSIFN